MPEVVVNTSPIQYLFQLGLLDCLARRRWVRVRRFYYKLGAAPRLTCQNARTSMTSGWGR
jgi:hypothetical protein